MKNPPYPDYRWAVAPNLYLLTAVWGVAQVFTQNTGLYFVYWFVYWLSLASTATSWAVIDARYAGRPMPHIVQHLFFMTCDISLPVYLIGSRGVRGLGWLLLHGIGLMVVSCICFYATVLLVYGPLVFTGR